MKSKGFIFVGLVFAVLLIGSAVAEEATPKSKKEEKNVKVQPKAEEQTTPKAEETTPKQEAGVDVADTNQGGQGGGRGGGGQGGGRGGIHAAGGRHRGGGREEANYGVGVEEVEVADTNYRGRPIWRRPRRGGGGGRFEGVGPVEEADANYYGGGGWGGHGGGYGGGGSRGGGGGGHSAEP